MNLILTLDCNNHCPYCFQQTLDKNYKQQYLTLENLQKILEWAKCPEYDIIKILGGEPTLYKDFIQAVEMIKSFYPINYISIITNLLGNQENIEYIYSILNENNKIGLLINTTIDNNKKELFNERLKHIYCIIENNKNIINKVSFSITLMQNKMNNKIFINNIKNLFLQYPKIDNLRVGLELPGALHDQLQYQYDEDFCELMEAIPESTIIAPDCNWPLCLLSSSIEQKYKSRFQIQPLRIGCNMPPIDILPDLSTKYCFGSNNKYCFNNIFSFPDYYSLITIFVGLEKIRIPSVKKCQECIHFLNNECYPCHAFDNTWAIKQN